MNQIFPAAAPLLLATLGALCSEYAGVLAVFMDGAITLAGFLCVAITAATGNAAIGCVGATAITVAALALVARFTERTKANPFLTGLAVNLFSAGVTSWLSAALFDTRGTVALSESIALPPVRAFAFPLAAALAVLVALTLRYTRVGVNLRVTGSSATTLTARGIKVERYRVGSWMVAAFFASAAGCVLALSLGAWVPNLSAGRGWTALAACYLGLRNPLLCILAALAFAGAEYATTVMQGFAQVPGTLILGLPYVCALLVFVLLPRARQ